LFGIYKISFQLTEMAATLRPFFFLSLNLNQVWLQMLTENKIREIHEAVRRRVMSGVSVEKMAALIGVDKVRLVRWENGKAPLQPWAHGRLMHTLKELEDLRSVLPYSLEFADIAGLRAALRDLRAGRFDMLAPAAPEAEGQAHG